MDKPFWLEIKAPNSGGLTAQMAWNYVRDYSTMATVQLLRILNNNVVAALGDEELEQVGVELGLSPEQRAGIDSIHAAQRTADAHFYLNCWRIVALNAYRIAKAIGNEKLDQFLVDQQCPVNSKGNGLYFDGATQSITLGWYAQGRDHFEHIDERIYGGRKWGKVRADAEKIVDLTGGPSREGTAYYPTPSFTGTHMLVGNSTWEITWRAHRKLQRAVSRLDEIGGSVLVEQRNREN